MNNLSAADRAAIACNTLNPLTAEMDFFGTRPMFVWAGLTILLLLLLWSQRERLGLSVAAAWAFFLAYALALVEFPAGTRGCYERAFEASAGATFIELAVLPLALLFMSKTSIKWCWVAIAVLVAIDLPAIWMHRNGLMIAPSFDLAFCAMALPFLPWPLWLAVLPTIFTHHASTALLILGAQGAAFVAVKNRGWQWRQQLSVWAAFLLLIATLLAVAYAQAEGEWLTRGVRMRGYERAMSFWLYGVTGTPFFPIRWREISWYTTFFGYGPGSFSWLSMMMANFEGVFDLNLHSDFLQIIFETGLLGFGFFAAVAIRAARRAWHDPVLLPALAGVGACMSVYHPLRFFPTMLLIALIALEALYPEKEEPGVSLRL